MAKMFRPRRGTTAKNAACVGGVGELTVDTEKGTVRVHDGSTAGGTELARTKDLSAYAKTTDIPAALTSVIGNDKGSLELKPASGASYGGYIDFHYSGSTADYTARIIESAQGTLELTAANGVTVNGKKVALTTNLSAYATTATLANYALTSAIPTKTSDLTNDSNFTSLGSVTATVNSSVGTPSVTVSITGDGNNKGLAFAFKNLKGATGDSGASGVAYITAQGGSASSWYRKWSNGITECGGYVSANRAENLTITLATAMPHVNYHFGASGGGHGAICVTTQSTTKVFVKPEATYTEGSSELSGIVKYYAIGHS